MAKKGYVDTEYPTEASVTPRKRVRAPDDPDGIYSGMLVREARMTGSFFPEMDDDKRQTKDRKPGY